MNVPANRDEIKQQQQQPRREKNQNEKKFFVLFFFYRESKGVRSINEEKKNFGQGRMDDCVCFSTLTQLFI